MEQLIKQDDVLSVPKGWEIKKLGEVCEYLFAGGDVPKDNSSKKETNIFRIPIFSNGEKDKGLYGYTNVARVTKPSITISARGTIGYSEIRKESFYPAIRLIVVTPNTNILDLEFLKYVIGGIDFAHSGSSIPQLTVPMIKEYPIPLPPLPEQLHIVSILDQTFAALAKAKENAQRNLQNAKELFESYLQGVFEKKGEGWKVKMLVEITSHLGDGLHGTPKYTENGDYYFINGNNLNNGVILYKDGTKRVSVEEYNKYKKNLNNNTVLVSINGTLGNVAFYNNEKIILGKSACYFNLKEGVDKNFVKYVISSPYFLNYAHKEATGATIKNVSLKTMREFKVPLPSLTDQETIVSKLNALSAETKRLEAIYQQKLLNLEEMKKSVLQKAFNGEL
ncbi:MAG: restriction endonuclease subunit S [Bacteroidia bacterium]|nr:restriction endonuclease subunit S [Bacteroidia bacterium]